jgi:hypothetical protein
MLLSQNAFFWNNIIWVVCPVVKYDGSLAWQPVVGWSGEASSPNAIAWRQRKSPSSPTPGVRSVGEDLRGSHAKIYIDLLYVRRSSPTERKAVFCYIAQQFFFKLVVEHAEGIYITTILERVL